ncbi:MAG: YitT family protein [Oscillospiraceae bacterium]
MLDKREVFKDFVYNAANAFLQAIAVHCFISSCNIAPGGVSGIAIMANYLFMLPIGAMTLLLNVPLIILSYRYLGKKSTIKTLVTIIIMTVVQDVIVTPYFPKFTGERLVLSAFGGIALGLGQALIFMRGSTTGGMDIAAKLLQLKAPHMQTGYALMVVDCCVVIASVFVYRDINTAFYGLLCIICTTQTIDALLYGSAKGTMVTIISSKNQEIAQDIILRLDRSATFLKSRGAYNKAESETLLCVVDKKQFYIVKQIIDFHDPDAFVIVSETKEVYGEGFKEKENVKL